MGDVRADRRSIQTIERDACASGVVVACSAPARRYRERLRAGADGLRLVELDVSRDGPGTTVAVTGDLDELVVRIADRLRAQSLDV